MSAWDGSDRSGGAGRRLRTTVLGVALGVAASVAAACATSEPAGPEISGQCAAAVQIDGRLYAQVGELDASLEAGDPVGSVLRRVGCYDTPGHGDPDDTVKFDGDSNFLPVGTTLHRVEGRSEAEALTAHHQGAWILLEREE